MMWPDLRYAVCLGLHLPLFIAFRFIESVFPCVEFFDQLAPRFFDLRFLFFLGRFEYLDRFGYVLLLLFAESVVYRNGYRVVNVQTLEP